MRAWLLSLLLLGQVPSARAADPAALLEAQVAVLRQLLEEGVVDAAYQLTLLYRANPDQPVFAAARADGWLAEAAADGHSKAVRSLGLALIRTPDPTEGATLLAAAALLGDARAAADLRLLPLFTPLSAAQVSGAFNDALERLAASRIVDCAAMPEPCPKRAAQPLRLSPRDLLRIQGLNERGPFDDAGIERLLAPLLAKHSVFDEEAAQRFRQRRDQANLPLLAQARGLASAGAEPQAHADRREARERAARRALAASIDRETERYRGEIQRALEGFNSHRDPEDRVAMEAVLDEIAEGYP